MFRGYILALTPKGFASKEFLFFFLLTKGTPNIKLYCTSENKMVIQLYFVKAGYHLLLQFNFNILGPPAYEL
jgi:hypothetical protein